MSTDLERALLGAILGGYRDLPDLPITPDDFSDPRHGEIWRAALQVHESGGQPDPFTVRAALPSEVRFPNGPVYLAELVEACPHTAQAPEYARQLLDHAGRRRLREASTAIGQLADSDRDVSELVEDARARVDAAVSCAYTSHAQTVGDVLPDVLDIAEKGTTPGLRTPWPDIDRLTTGFRPGSLIVFGARPSHGKSLVGANLAAHTALRHGRGAFVASLEMSRTELVQRILSAEAGINLTAVMNGTVTDRDWDRIAPVVDKLQNAPVFIEDDAGVTTGAIRAAVRDVARRADLAVVIVDYLQLITPRDRRVSREQQVAEISRALKLLAREQNVAVVALAQVNRAPTTRRDGKPTLSDLRESGAIEADADVVILLHRDDDVPHELQAIVAKNRSGPIGESTLLMQGHLGRIVSLTDYTPEGAAR